jgi:hypothetical protein
MASHLYPERQTFLHPPTPPPTPPSSKMNCPFPSITASKREVKSYIRALLAIYPNAANNPTQGHGNSFDSSIISLRKPTHGLSTLQSFRSIRSLAMITPLDAAICKIWFDGAYLGLLLHIGSLRRELRFMGFEEEVAQWLSREIENRFQGLGLKGKVSSLLFFALYCSEETEGY